VPPQTLTVLAAIRPGEEDRLRADLRRVGDDIQGTRRHDTSVRIEFTRSRHIHFARFAILTDPDRGPGRMRLLYSANFDGDVESHLKELTDITSDMDAIWGRCAEYKGIDDFPRFIRAHAHEPNAFYIAFRNETVTSLKAATLAPPATGWRLVTTFVTRITRAAPLAFDLLAAVGKYGVGNVVGGGLRVIASLDRFWQLRLINRLTGNQLPPRKSDYSSVSLDNCSAPPLVAGDELPSGLHPLPPTFREDVVAQNQLTLVTVVQPGRADRVRAVMAGIDAYARRLAPPGSLSGISTIHFVKWLVIDNGRRLVMLSDYDGSWESYIDEFAEMILSGLDAIWETSHGFPPDGARDLPAFKRFLRMHQVASEVFFSAYPETTVLKIARDRTMPRMRRVVPSGTGLLQR
jgi:hypothetical protein